MQNTITYSFYFTHRTKRSFPSLQTSKKRWNRTFTKHQPEKSVNKLWKRVVLSERRKNQLQEKHRSIKVNDILQQHHTPSLFDLNGSSWLVVVGAPMQQSDSAGLMYCTQEGHSPPSLSPPSWFNQPMGWVWAPPPSSARPATGRFGSLKPGQLGAAPNGRIYYWELQSVPVLIDAPL